MKLLCDTRQKAGKHLNIERYCSENNITMIPQYLNVGDYMLENGDIAVDTKKDIGELAKDLYIDKKKFNRKYRKCYQDKIKLVVLIEEKVNSVQELVGWQSKFTKVDGRLLLNMIEDLKVSYGIKFVFCDKNETGRYLISILKGEFKNV